jgi:hypothetical protein
MTFWIPLTFLAISVVSLILLIILSTKQPWRRNTNLYYPLGLCAALVLGISAFFLGLKLFSSDNAWWVACGTFLLVSGLQITLWALGIRLDILGNRSVHEDSEGLLPLAGSFLLKESLFKRPQSIFRDLHEWSENLYRLFPLVGREIVNEIEDVVRNPESNSNLIPLLRDILEYTERLRLQSTALDVSALRQAITERRQEPIFASEGESRTAPTEETEQELLEGQQNLREQMTETKRKLREQMIEAEQKLRNEMSETQRDLIEAIANFRVEFLIRR